MPPWCHKYQRTIKYKDQEHRINVLVRAMQKALWLPLSCYIVLNIKFLFFSNCLLLMHKNSNINLCWISSLRYCFTLYVHDILQFHVDILWSSIQTILPSIHDSHFLFEKFVYILCFLLIALQEHRVTVQFQINTVRIGIHSLLFIVSFVVLRRSASYYVVHAGFKLRFFFVMNAGITGLAHPAWLMLSIVFTVVSQSGPTPLC